jgi:hypothetical protein
MPNKAEQFLVVGVPMRKIISGVCEASRVMIFVFEGMCLPVFWVFCGMRVSSVGG